MAEKKIKEVTTDAPAYTKAQLMASDKYASRRDLIGALLDENNIYTCEQVNRMIKNYLKGMVI